MSVAVSDAGFDGGSVNRVVSFEFFGGDDWLIPERLTVHSSPSLVA